MTLIGSLLSWGIAAVYPFCYLLPIRRTIHFLLWQWSFPAKAMYLCHVHGVITNTWPWCIRTLARRTVVLGLRLFLVNLCRMHWTSGSTAAGSGTWLNLKSSWTQCKGPWSTGCCRLPGKTMTSQRSSANAMPCLVPIIPRMELLIPIEENVFYVGDPHIHHF